MIRIAALNDSSSESSNAEEVGPSQEALEAEATRVYRKAISLLAHGETEKAKENIELVLKNPYIYKAEWEGLKERCTELPHDIALKYSCFKNLGNICMTEGKHKEACHYYMKAVHLDSSEVTLWQKLGTSAIKIKDFQLAVVAFQEGLLVNHLHWPCMDQLLSVLFVLGSYEDCLGLAIETLRRDPGYVKALSFKDKIFELQPSLIPFAKEYFKGAEVLFCDTPYDREKGDRFISTCLKLRPPTKEPSHVASPSFGRQKVSKDSIERFTWRDLISLLNCTYDQLQSQEPKAFVETLDFEDIMEVFVVAKLKKRRWRCESARKGDVFQAGRRLCRSLSVNDNLLSNRSVKVEAEPALGGGGLAARRRQTIELGEGQESSSTFCVASRRCEGGGDAPKDNKQTTGSEVKEEEEEEDQEEGMRNSDKGNNKEAVVSEGGEEEEEDDDGDTEEDMEEDEEEEEECESGREEQRKEKEGEEHQQPPPPNDEGEFMMTGEGERAAADQLKDIMAMKPPAQILSGEFEFHQDDDDDYDYFDGGVYEVDDEDEVVEDEEEEDVEVIAESSQQQQQQQNELNVGGSQQQSGEGDKKSGGVPDGKSSSSFLEDGQGSTPVAPNQEESCQQPPPPTQTTAASPKDDQKPPTVARDSVAATVVPPPKKRHKRGLERELEQLDYWGRRKAREAKRRRRTLTSKLVGDFEESEYLTWAHLIRSFIPAPLLTLEECKNSSEDKTDAEEAAAVPAAELGCEKEKELSPRASAEREIESSTEMKRSPFFFKEFLRREFSEEFETSEWDSEEVEVGEFVCQQQSKNGGVVHVMRSCLSELIKKFGRVWPMEVALAASELYTRLSEHENVRATLKKSGNDSERLADYANRALTHSELLLSLHGLRRENIGSREEEGEEREIMLQEKLLQLMEDDAFQLELLLARPEIWGVGYLQAHLRVMWIQTQLKILRGLPEEGTLFLQMLMEQIKLAGDDGNCVVDVHRCRVSDDVHKVDHPYLQSQLNGLQRSQMMEKIEWKFSAGHYGEVIQILTSLFKDLHTDISPDSNSSCPPRLTQLLILVESLFRTRNAKGMIEWGSKCVNEAVVKFNCQEVEDAERNRWIDAIRQFLRMIVDTVLSDSKSMLEASHDHAVNMVSSLVDVLVIQLEQGANLPQPYFSTLSPWVILHAFISDFEKRLQPAETSSSPQNHDEAIVNPVSKAPAPSTLLLITAHDEVGKNGWCCLEQGHFLLYMLDVLLLELENRLPEEHRLILQQGVEQILFCLFSHPSRKTKYKHLRDHGGQSIPLTWERALQLYEYYLPSQLPEFQSAQLPSITDDVAVLFRRILSLMPDEFKHADQMKRMNAFIDGEIVDLDALPSFVFPRELQDCYYLLADNHFKGKEWEQAIHYYKLDVSVNANRIDSWAPMGLAIKAQLETVLNSCEVIKNTDDFFKEAQRAVKCLDRGLQLDQYFSNLWVEKGGLVYMIHSHASRLLNQDLNPDMSIEMFESLENIKSEMLGEASRCFCRASKIVEEGWDDESLPDERWLYQYMLGKLAEKTGKPPQVVLDYYFDAMDRLHKMGAKYPPKISYNNPQEYAVEALEIYFRIHIYIFKQVTQRPGKVMTGSTLTYVKSIVDDLARCPFALGKEFGTESTMDLDKEPQNEEDMGAESFPSTKRRKSVEEEAVGGAEGEDAKRMKLSEEEIVLEELLPQVEVDEKKTDEVISSCLDAFRLCVTRFPHHYKSLYRMAYFYHNSKSQKDNVKARNLLLGCDSWQKVPYMASAGLFSERKMSTISPKNSNLFHGVWRIPHDEVDRPGSFAAHMYRCVSLCLEVLQEMKDFYTILEVAISLRHSPDKDKKYLRDNERELLFEHAAQVGVQTMKDKFRLMFRSTQDPPSNNAKSEQQFAFLIESFKAHKQMSRYLPIADPPFAKLMMEAYAAIKGVSVDGNSNIIHEIENFCIRRNPSNSSSSLNSTASFYQHISSKLGGPPMPHSTTSFRRGRPPGPSRDYGVARFKTSQEKATPTSSASTAGQSIAVQQAYKVYENLIQAQTILNNKNLDNKSTELYQKKYEEYKQQMLKYLQIPSVSQFFHSSLQSLGTSAAKLPPPPNNQTTVVPTAAGPAPRQIRPQQQTSTSSSSAAIKKQSLSSLAERSKAHGISISAVSRSEAPVMKTVKPSMSISLSQSKLGTNQITIRNVPKENVSKTSSKKKTHSSPQNQGSVTAQSLPKLPVGTTLSRQSEVPCDVPAAAAAAASPPLKKQPPGKEDSLASTLISPKRGVTITQANSVPPDKKQQNSSSISFQAAFQASLDKSKQLGSGSAAAVVPFKEPGSISTPTPRQLKQGIKLSTLKHLSKASEKEREARQSSYTKPEGGNRLSKVPVDPLSTKPSSDRKDGSGGDDDDDDDADADAALVITLD